MTIIDKVAWLRLEDGKVLGARSRGKDTCYLPGGKREPGESDTETLVREIAEELTVSIDPAGAVHAGTFEAPAHGKDSGTTVRMTCYTAEYEGTLAPSSEIEELVWLGYADRERVSAVTGLVFDELHRSGLLR
ncbi:NUDIX hydrolase [Streptomyces xiamenensis]|uniref:NUDIX hydrolase n=1 Tax=Streptomyces xiamenensis TaxID=408015 RepID=A0A0F7FUD6_9ACTN|nr:MULTISPECIES: NUDIX domain-containing protein [Streptomyces]AKG43415.1 NUDIX hydrolase [Streptomyces xiamenensis]